MAILGVLSQVTLLVLNLLHGGLFQWNTLYGALIATAIVPLILRRTVRLHLIDLGVLAAAYVGVLSQLIQTFRGHTSIEPRLFFVGTFLFLIAFNVLPIRWAGLYAAVMYPLFGALTFSQPGSATLLVELGVVVLLSAYFLVFGERVTAERTGSLTYQHLALTDPLTGLENRRAMYERLERAVALNQSGHASTVLLLDLDHFKQVNDQHGHPIGDQVLQAIAAVLVEVLRPGDTVARWGGEEFLMLIDAPEASTGADVAERVLSAIRTAEMPLSLQVTASCGVCWSDEVSTVTEWLNRVDERLYAAKSAGRDQLRDARRTSCGKTQN